MGHTFEWNPYEMPQCPECILYIEIIPELYEGFKSILESSILAGTTDDHVVTCKLDKDGGRVSITIYQHYLSPDVHISHDPLTDTWTVQSKASFSGENAEKNAKFFALKESIKK